MKPNYISIVTISALFYQLLIAPLSAMTNPASPHMDDHASVAVASVSIPIVDDEQVSLPVPTPQKQLGALIEDLRMFQGNGKAELEQHGLWPLCQEIKNLRSLSKDAIAVLKAEKDKLSPQQQCLIKNYIEGEKQKVKDIQQLTKKVNDIKEIQDQKDKRIAEENYAFDTKVTWMALSAVILFVVGVVVALFYPVKTFLSSFDETITGSTSYSPFAFFAQQDMHTQFNATTTIPYLKDHFQHNIDMQNTLVEAAYHYIKKEVLPSHITDALVGYADFFMGSFKYISSFHQQVFFALCFNPTSNMTSALNVIKGQYYGAYDFQPPVCEKPDDVSVVFNIIKGKPELSGAYPSVDGAYKLAVAQPQKPGSLMDNQYATMRRAFVEQSADDVHDLIQNNAVIPKLIFNMTQQMRSHICPAEIMVHRLQDALDVLNSVVAPSNHTFFYFWFNKNGGLVRTNYSTVGSLGNISSASCDWQSNVKFGNDAHVRIALNKNGRMWLTEQPIDFLPNTGTVEKTHTRKLSASQELTDTATWRQSLTEALPDTESVLNSGTGTGTWRQSASKELVDTNTTEQSPSKELIDTNTTEHSASEGLSNTNTTEQSVSKELAGTESVLNSGTGTGGHSASEALPGTTTDSVRRSGTDTVVHSASEALAGTNTTEQSASDSSERSLSETTDRNTWTSSKSLTALRWLANLTGLENSSQAHYSWTEMIANGAAGSPPARYGHAAGRMGDEMFIGFGISASGSYLSDTWALNLTSLIWRNLGASISARGYPGTFTYNDSTWVFQGYGSTDSMLTQFSKDGYQEFPTSGYAGTTIGRLAMTNIADTFYAFGGSPSSSVLNYMNTLYRLQNTSALWQDVTPTISPASRGSCQFAVVHQDAYIFGGGTYSGGVLFKLNDVWKFNPLSGWAQMITNGASGSPAGRYAYTMGVLGTNIFIFGGTGNTNDLWKLDTQLMKWGIIMANGQAGSPPGRGFAAADFVKFNSDLYIFGGNYGGTNGCYNDLWRLRQTKVRLYNVTVSPNPIMANQNFTLSWIAEVSGGATGHLANITFNGHKYVQTFDGTLGSIILMANSTLGNNFSIPLSVQDRLSAFDSTSLHIPFEIDEY
ncbi:MAG TPA: hypothetical protein DIC42_06270 [Holosporales bacterium]|nr:hypothetical protein [Holosporales bacterium]